MTRKCPECGNRSAVIDSRETEITVRRIRECIKCKARWTTWEATKSPEALLSITRKSMKQIARASQLCERALADLSESPTPNKRDSGQRPVNGASKCRRHATASSPDSRKGREL